MSLFLAELRKVWGNRLFPLLLAVLAAANLLLLWMGTRPTTGQPSAAAYRAVGAQLDGLTMEEKGAYLHGKYTEIESLVKWPLLQFIDMLNSCLVKGIGKETIDCFSWQNDCSPLFQGLQELIHYPPPPFGLIQRGP